MTSSISKRYIVFIVFTFFLLSKVAADPGITSFSPSAGPAGTLLTINGTDLGNPASLTVGGATATIVSNTGSQVVCMVMPGAITGVISITTAQGSFSTSSNFTVTFNYTPKIQEGSKITINGTSGLVRFGASVSISADGNTAVSGAPEQNNAYGRAHVFVKTSGQWALLTTLAPNDGTGDSYFGSAVAISADGNTIAIGGIHDNSYTGAVWIFIKNGSGIWVQQGAKLVGNDASSSGQHQQGFSLAISADGNTVITGAPADNSNLGVVWVYFRNNGVWQQQGPKLWGSGLSSFSRRGSSVALSANGNTAIIGGPHDADGKGAVWIFTRAAGVWTQEGSKLVGTGAAPGIPSQQGTSVSMSADGNTAFVGAPVDNNYKGAFWVYKRSGGNWVQSGNKVVTAGAPDFTQLGISLSATYDGNTLAVGAYGDGGVILGCNNASGTVGAVWLYKRSAYGTYIPMGNKLVGTGYVNYSLQGGSISIAPDGNSLVVGGSYDNCEAGAIWFFKAPPTNTLSLTSAPATLSQTICNNSPATAITYTTTGATGATITGLPPGVSGSWLAGQVSISGTATVPGIFNYGIELSGGSENGNAKGTFTVNPLNIAGIAGGTMVAATGIVNTSAINLTETGCGAIISSLVPTGGNPITGGVNASVVIDSVVKFYNGVPYAQRHYDIEPLINPSGATATVILYFKQEEFNAYNNARGALPAFPGWPTDGGGISNIRIMQFHGTGLQPGGYSGVTEIINPQDENITWNASENWWEVKFAVTGFSGFYATSLVAVLPINLLSFYGADNGNNNVLEWTLAASGAALTFEIERSSDGRNYNKIATLKANNVSKFFTYTDLTADNNTTNYYRLKMISGNNTFEYSTVVKIVKNIKQFRYSILSNPIGNDLNISFNNPVQQQITIKLLNIDGKLLMSKDYLIKKGSSNIAVENMQRFSKGIYVLSIVAGNENFISKLVK